MSRIRSCMEMWRGGEGCLKSKILSKCKQTESAQQGAHLGDWQMPESARYFSCKFWNTYDLNIVTIV